MDNIEKDKKVIQPVEEAIRFIEENSKLKISYNIIEASESHGYTNACAGGTADGRTECVWVAAWDLSDDLLKFLPDSSSYVWFWKLNGKIPLNAGSALGPPFGIRENGKEGPYASIPVDIWWYDDNSQENFTTRSAQIIVHELINTIKGTLESDPYYCTAPTGKDGDPAYIHEADNLKNLADCIEKLKNRRQNSIAISIKFAKNWSF